MIADYTEAPVCHVDDLVDGELKEVRVGDTDVLLARADGQYYALFPKCSHYQGPLVKGLLNGHRLVCPWHNACFDIRTGHRLEAPALNGLPTHEVRIENDQVFVRLTTNQESLENPMVTPDEAITETYVIIGSGGAGAFAAEGMREGGFAGKIVMLTESGEAPYDRPNCSKDYLQGKAPDEWMTLRSEEFYQDYGIDVRTGQHVTSLDPVTKRIELASGEAITYDKALLCSGGKPNALPGIDVDLKGVYSLRSLHDSQTLRELGKQGKRVVIIGSSFIGLEGAMSLRKLGSEVDVVGLENTPFEKILGEKIGRVIQGWHEKEGIRFHLGRKVAHIEGEGTVNAVVLDNGERISADFVLLGLGVKPRTDFLKDIPFEKDGGVKTDAYLNVKDGLYAAGDIAHYPTNDGFQRIEHWKVAGQQGHVAGLAMAGKEESYQAVPFFWSNQQGKRINYVGHATKVDEIIYEGDPEKDDSFLALYIQDGQIKAAAGLKRDQDIIAIRELMHEGRMPAVETARDGVKWVKELKKA
ncbi:Rieske 2Fe-2S domain-containing protein [Spirosoma sp. HMF3257]|uniref:Pyridine nucleotide-disulfide oxidoreductase n=1 Tax=Spirosoma telluris TaxID=2183553 RepID=A0A327NP26_9BACT|nr:Rieske 2Fe-2S domain-containing protein [Spirosoma telluris]RAI76927.1 pyridine nucleotide-disulfide oxidoreductase [Spirosoma telluris]